MSFSRLVGWLGRDGLGRPVERLNDVMLARWVDGLLRRLPGPWHRTCLNRSAVLYHLLRRAGRPVELWIGVHKGADTRLGAHAWLVHAGEPYLESEPEHSRTHNVIARFPETGGARG
jgi:hypothetical protein